jgi:hypothetical protein
VRGFLAALVVILAIGCEGCPKPPPDTVVVPPMSDAVPPPPTGSVTCLDLCRHGQAMHCKWSDPTPAGATCVTVCQNNQDQVDIAPWDLDCRTRSPSCASPGCQ